MYKHIFSKLFKKLYVKPKTHIKNSNNTHAKEKRSKLNLPCQDILQLQKFYLPLNDIFTICILRALSPSFARKRKKPLTDPSFKS